MIPSTAVPGNQAATNESEALTVCAKDAENEVRSILDVAFTSAIEVGIREEVAEVKEPLVTLVTNKDVPPF